MKEVKRDNTASAPGFECQHTTPPLFFTIGSLETRSYVYVLFFLYSLNLNSCIL